MPVLYIANIKRYTRGVFQKSLYLLSRGLWGIYMGRKIVVNG